jgi:hypothetical protein
MADQKTIVLAEDDPIRTYGRKRPTSNRTKSGFNKLVLQIYG